MNAKRPETNKPAKNEAGAGGDRDDSPLKDAPFEVDPSDDGDMATPKPELDEQDIKEQEERR